MKKIYFTLFLLFSLKILAQDVEDKCGFKIELNKMNPALLQKQETQLKEKIKELNQLAKTSKSNEATVYQIPIVIHIIHVGEDIGTGLNLSEDVVLNYVKRLNLYYRYLNGDVSFDQRYGLDANIEFVLAVRDPNGNCTNGIKRYDYSNNATYVSSGINNDTGVPDVQIRTAMQWDPKKYYNVYLGKVPGVNGYAYYPGSSTDGAFINASLASNPTNKTIAHEIGHGLGLRHTFEGSSGTTCPSTDPLKGDLCEDTPPHLETSQDCNKNQDADINSCATGYIDSRTGLSLKSNKYFINNIMSYSPNSCKFMFTQDQVNRMTATLETTRKGLLAKNGNLSLVPLQQPEVDFVVDKTVICPSNNTVTLRDASSCIPNSFLTNSQYPGISFLWTVTNGTTTLSSTMQNPSFALTEAGTYDVTLTVATTTGTSTKTKSKLISVGEVGTPVSCKFGTYQSGNFGTTLSKVEFATIQNTTSEGLNDQYSDFKCTNITEVNASKSYELKTTISTSTSRNSYVKAWIDYNNNGSFDKNEVVFAGKLLKSTTQSLRSVLSRTIVIPNQTVTDKVLTMRVIFRSLSSDLDPYSDAAISDSACYTSSLNVFDVEDYGVVIRGGTLGLENFESEIPSYVIYKNNNSFRVETNKIPLQEIYVYDISGKVIYHLNKINSAHYDLPILNNNQVYIIKLKDTNGAVYSKKIVN
ncbi:M43 family zinc metalloprotease [Flavobacterium poyangense]|uniref:M43 family zinc metalloprotease n=1 Tax=Flavobacterium poyangense TaxID=2204302 RepID=UPI00142490AC|nr:M43 family zinc metalloprotease [Flavobacterium sp. JXAS1]